MLHAYWTEDADGNEQCHYGVGIKAYDKALADAQEQSLRVIEAKYTLEDTEMVKDFTKKEEKEDDE